MMRARIAEARVLECWQAFQEELQRAIAPLTEEQMNKQLVPNLRSTGEIAAHIVYGRALWLHHVLGKEAVELEPMLCWDDPDAPPRTTADALHGLDLTWRIINAVLMNGLATDDIADEEIEKLRIIWDS
jgi:hypothetical protein